MYADLDKVVVTLARFRCNKDASRKNYVQRVFLTKAPQQKKKKKTSMQFLWGMCEGFPVRNYVLLDKP